jgi:hypothetical protein
MINDIRKLEDSGSFMFSACLAAHFGQPSRKFVNVTPSGPSECLTYSHYQFGKAAARVDLIISISTEWPHATPCVTAKADWLTPGIDWHIYPDSSLCWDIDARWQDRCKLTFQMLDRESAFVDVSGWLKLSVCYLLEQNLIARKAGLDRLPISSLQFEHGELGVKQYSKERVDFCNQLANQLTAKSKTPVIAATTCAMKQ